MVLQDNLAAHGVVLVGTLLVGIRLAGSLPVVLGILHTHLHMEAAHSDKGDTELEFAETEVVLEASQKMEALDQR